MGGHYRNGGTFHTYSRASLHEITGIGQIEYNLNEHGHIYHLATNDFPGDLLPHL